MAEKNFTYWTSRPRPKSWPKMFWHTWRRTASLR